MFVSQPPPRRKKRRSGFQHIFVIATTTTMLLTGAMGLSPDNPLTLAFQRIVAENVPSVYLEPFNAYLESLSLPTIHPHSAPHRKPETAFDPIGTLEVLFSKNTIVSAPPTPNTMAIVETALVSIQETVTQWAVVSPSQSFETPFATGSTHSSSGLNITPSPSISPSATLEATVAPAWVYVPPTKTRKPAPKKTATPVVTSSPGIVYSGFSISNIDLGEGPGVVFPVELGKGEKFSITFDYNIYNEPCPGCLTTLVIGMGIPGSGVCTYSGTPGSFPGISGSATANLIAPAAEGPYSVTVEYYQGLDCTSALGVYGAGSGNLAQSVYSSITVVPTVLMYLVAGVDGNLGGRSGADNVCALSGPAGANKFHAFLGFSGSDSIAAMDTNYGIPATAKILTTSGNVVALNWPDLLSNGLTYYSIDLMFGHNGYWWSGASDDSGGVVLPIQTCSDWTDNTVAFDGWVGDGGIVSGSGWMSSTTQTCDLTANLLCIAFP